MTHLRDEIVDILVAHKVTPRGLLVSSLTATIKARQEKPVSQSIASDRISESSIMRAAGNIASGLVSRVGTEEGRLTLANRAIVAEESVALARAIAAEVQRTKPTESV